MGRRGVTTQRNTLALALAAILLLFFISLSSYGCKHNRHTADPHLQKMDEMLTARNCLRAARERASNIS